MLSNDGFPTLTLGVSSCLLGNEVRFDSSHKHNDYIDKTLGRFFTLKTYCPEVAIGLGTPRPPIRLVDGENNSVRVIEVKDQTKEHTQALTEYSEQTAQNIDTISGYIFKKGSPSCGMTRVKVYSAKGGMPRYDGVGVFANAIKQANPLLPTEDEGRLNDLGLRDNFLMRIYVYHDWQQLRKQGITAAKLIAFHAEQKYLLMAHDQAAAKTLGRLVAEAGKHDINTLADEYIHTLMPLLSKVPSKQSHTNVMQHIMGYLSKQIDAQDKQELHQSVLAYHAGKLPLVAPLTLLKHHFNKHPQDYIAKQRYLSPYPVELRW